MGLRPPRARAPKVRANARGLRARAVRTRSRDRLWRGRLHRADRAARTGSRCDRDLAGRRRPRAAAARSLPGRDGRGGIVSDAIPEGPFDVVVASDTFLYVPVPDIERGLSRLEAALAPNGALVAVDYVGGRTYALLTGDEVHDVLVSQHEPRAHVQRTARDQRRTSVPRRPVREDRPRVPKKNAGVQRRVIVFWKGPNSRCRNDGVEPVTCTRQHVLAAWHLVCLFLGPPTP